MGLALLFVQTCWPTTSWAAFGALIHGPAAHQTFVGTGKGGNNGGSFQAASSSGPSPHCGSTTGPCASTDCCSHHCPLSLGHGRSPDFRATCTADE